MHERQHIPPNNGDHDDDSDSVESERSPTPPPRIYVASLSDYNNGRLHGAWLDAARDPGDIRRDIAVMLARSDDPSAEEFAVHDFEGFGAWHVDEYDSVELTSRVARGIAEHGAAFAAWADAHESEPERFGDFATAYRGHYDSVEDYAMQEVEAFGLDDSLGILPEGLRTYLHFDYAALARDLQAGGDLYVCRDPGGGVWLFDGNT